MKNIFSFNYSACYLSLFSAIALSIESYLSLDNKSLCPTTACKTVSTYLKINEPVVVSAGAAAFWFLTAILFFSERYPKRLWALPIAVLAIALAIDSNLMGFQFFTIDKHCILCIATAISLIVITTFYCIRIKSTLILTIMSLMWLGVFFTHSIFTMPAPHGAYNNMVLYSIEGSSNSESNYPQFTLIMSMNCPHCLNIVEYLNERFPLQNKVSIASVDTDKLSLQKLAFFLQKASPDSNPFLLLLEAKKKTDFDGVGPLARLKNSNNNTLNFISNLNITTIPTLLIEDSLKEKKIITGSDRILFYLQKHDI